MHFQYGPNPILDPCIRKIIQHKRSDLPLKGRECIENDFEYFIASDTLIVYVIDTAILESTPWDTVIKNYLVLKRYDLSLLDFHSLNWEITYP